MTRLCIYVTYDFENKIDDYIGYMLRKLRNVVDSLIVVCNYEYIVLGIEHVRPYADRIFFRKNKGFDAGAYKDIICKYLGFDEICKYDELLLVNDSFYGPLCPFKDMFCIAETIDVDYWGLVRAPSGQIEGYSYDTHIQSYFLAFRKNVLCSLEFRMFWEKIEYPRSLFEAIIKFEIGCNKYFSEVGFKSVAMTDLVQNCLFKEGDNPYAFYPLELIRDMHIPILKRKSLNFSNRGYENALMALKYIQDTGYYDVNLIKKHLFRLGKARRPKNIFLLLDEFYLTHARIFIYGAGVYGKNLAIYFKIRGWSFYHFLVTNTDSCIENCISFREAEIKEDDGIIIAVEKYDMFQEILDTVISRCSIDQVFSFDYEVTGKFYDSQER